MMLLFKLMTHFATGLVAFSLSTGIVNGFRYVMSPGAATNQNRVATPQPDTGVQEPNTSVQNRSGVYFTAPSSGSSTDCLTQDEIYSFGRDSFLQTNQMPHIRRMAWDGRWFSFETETKDGRSFEFFGIIPDSAESVSGNKRLSIQGKLIRLNNGEITGNVDATYLVDGCVLK